MESFADRRILYVSSVDISIGNGPGVNEREFILALLDELGPRIHFLIPIPEKNIPEINDVNFTFSLPHHRHQPIHYLLHIMSQLVLARNLLSHRRFDLLVFRLDVLPIVQYYISSRYHHPYVIKTLGGGVGWVLGEKGGWLGKALIPLNRRLVGAVVRGALGIDVCTTNYVRHFLKEFDIEQKRILLVDNAVNTERFFPIPTRESRHYLGLDRFEQIVGFVGGRPWERGGAQLVEIAPFLCERFPKLGIVIVGGGDGMGQLQRRARELGIENNCVFPGFVPFEHVADYINSFDIGVSLNLPELYQQTGVAEQKVRQYLACGKPVIVGPDGNEFVKTEEFGSMVAPNDLNAIQKEIEKWLLLEPAEKEIFCSRATLYATNYLSVKKALHMRFEFWEMLLG
jgi:glycosyltransferase involved in cell wall biosynthesis